jgi:hypothetical protein
MLHASHQASITPDRQVYLVKSQDCNPQNAGARQFDEAVTVWGAEPRDN